MPIEILMPALSPTMTEGTLAKWIKKEGDSVKPGDVIAEIETDKATMEVESIETGTVGKILISAGTQGVAVNSCIALLLAEGEDKKSLDSYKVKAAPAAAVPSAPAVSAAKAEAVPSIATASAPISAPSFSVPPTYAPAASAAPVSKSSSGRVKASPLAKRVASGAGVDLQDVEGSGPHGRIVRADVENALKQGGSKGRVRRNSQEYVAIPNSTMRKVIAKRLLESKQWVPHFYLNIHCKLDKLLEVRKDLNALAPRSEDGTPRYKVTVNDMIIKASALALKKVPAANAMWSEEAILQFCNVDVSVAVALEGGLITPIIRNADQKSLPVISAEMRDLATRARQGKLVPEEFQGGGFSISNLGMFGISNFNAIINPPQSCILAVGASEERAIVEDGALTKATMMTVTLSCDHRVVDGAVGAEFLSAFKEAVERPLALVL